MKLIKILYLILFIILSGINLSYCEDNFSELSTDQQVVLLKKQLDALSMRRQEDFQLIEKSLFKYAKENSLQYLDIDVKEEIRKLRKEIQLQCNQPQDHQKVEILTRTVETLHAEVRELQSSLDLSKFKTMQEKLQTDFVTLKNEIKNHDAELSVLKKYSNSNPHATRNHGNDVNFHSSNSERMPRMSGGIDHKLRHHTILKENMNHLEEKQRELYQDLTEIRYNLNGRIERMEVQQKNLVEENKNLSQQISGLDKLRGSMLELLEGIQGIETRVDNSLADIKNEISKVEFDFAQLYSQQKSLKLEQHGMQKKIQALSSFMSSQKTNQLHMNEFHQHLLNLQSQLEVSKQQNDYHKQFFNSHMNKIENSAKHHKLATHKFNSSMSLYKDLKEMKSAYDDIINKLPNECADIPNNPFGMYLIAPAHQDSPIMVECHGNWTVVQKRHDGSVDFNQSWENYAKGFGSPRSEFWIGNENLHLLTRDNRTQLRIIMKDIYERDWIADYDNLYVSSREEGYRLDVDNFHGNCSNALEYQNHMKFSAIDVDNDSSTAHCAGNYEGGWWFSHCQHANLNGRYNLGLSWFDSTRNEWIALKSSTMMINTRRF